MVCVRATRPAKTQRPTQLNKANDHSSFAPPAVEQMCSVTVLQSDHHCKYLSRSLHKGARLFTNVFACMNEWGGICAKVFTETTSYGESSVVRCFANLRHAARKFRHDFVSAAWCDNPAMDGAAIRNLAFCGAPGDQLRFPGNIIVVQTEEECDTACADLCSERKTLYFDTENVAYVVRTSPLPCPPLSLPHWLARARPLVSLAEWPWTE